MLGGPLEVDGVATLNSNLMVRGGAYVTGEIRSYYGGSSYVKLSAGSVQAAGSVPKFYLVDYDGVTAILANNDGIISLNNSTYGDVTIWDGSTITINSNLVVSGTTTGITATMVTQTNATLGATTQDALNYLNGVSFAPYEITYASSVTISKTNGNLQSLNAGTNNVTITISPDTTGYVSTMRFEFYGSGSTGITTNNINGASDLDISTNGWNSIVFDSGYGATKWQATQLTRAE